MPLTVTALAEHLEMPVPTDPAKLAELQQMLDAAASQVRASCGIAAAGPSTVRVFSAGGTALLLPVVRIREVTAVTDPAGQPVTPAEVDVDAGIVHVPTGRAGAWKVTVVVDDLPAGLELAALIVAKHLYETQRTARSAGRAGPQLAGAPAPGRSGFAVPHRAAELMAPYVLPGIA